MTPTRWAALLIGGILLLWLITAVVFFGSGRKIYYRSTLGLRTAITIFADEQTAKDLDTLTVTFHVDGDVDCIFTGRNTFSGMPPQNADPMVQAEAATNPDIDSRCTVFLNPGLEFRGTCHATLPEDNHLYVRFDEREFTETLTAALRSHLPADAVFHVRPMSRLWGDGENEHAWFVTRKRETR